MPLTAYRKIIESLPEPTLLLSVEGVVLAGNRPALGLLGTVKDNVLIQSLVEPSTESIEEYLARASVSEKLVAGQVVVRLGEGLVCFRSECSRLEPVYDVDAGETVLLLRLYIAAEANLQFSALQERIDALNTEVAKRKQIEADLRQQKEWLQVTLTSIGDAVLITDADGRISFMNPIAEALTGWDRASAMGNLHQDVFVVIDEVTREPLESPVSEVLQLNCIVNPANHSVLISRSGLEIPIADTAAPISIGGEFQGVVLVFQDVSAKRNLQRQLLERAEKLEAANRRKNTFLAMLAHELRNPMAPISNAVQLLKLNPSLVSEVTVILDRQTTHLNRLVNDLLDVSRITQGKITVSRERIDLATLVSQECSDHLSRFEQSNITLKITVPERPVTVMADQTRMTQVIGNLLHNAQKFTPEGGMVEVELLQKGSNASLSVKDTGKGLSASLIQELFEPFTQGDQSLDRTEGGLGLGLSLVKGIVELHGGKVDVQSGGEGEGATFIVTIPASGPARTVSEPIQVSGQRKKILLIEDNPDQARSMSLLLELLGSQVDVATDGLEGLRKADEINPDVIICDIGLPKLDGFGVAQRLRESKMTSSTLLIALTGYGQDDFIERAREAGFDRHFLKPMSLQEIEQVIVTR